MIPAKIKIGDTIGIPYPSRVADPIQVNRIKTVLERFGFGIRIGHNAYANTYEYTASAQERADDINAMVKDPMVKMIFFSGGDAGAEVLPYLDYEAIAHNPKIFSSFSDGTCILNAVYAMTGLVTYYGQGPGQFQYLRYYDWNHFETNFMKEEKEKEFFKDTPWVTLCDGVASGILIGGYPSLYAMMLTTKYGKVDKNKKYLLFLEAHEHFDPVAQAATAFALIEQSDMMDCVTGLLVGNYSPQVPPSYLEMIARIGQRRNIPVVYCDDFGHGNSHAILPIGKTATLDATAQTLWF
ncbi:MAG: LD-carboxypeptidase [Lachnospiraceae bacterium]|jgi:muramoyltetrapeptide carboxypeptidase|nr:LD-carboxypeptidase [Lachnospiraceae bacterium]